MTAYADWRFEVAWTNDADDPAPTWVDMTARVDGAITVTRGRAPETLEIQAGTMVVVLDDADKELTAMNTGSSLYPNVALGKMGRLIDTANGVDYIRFFGYLTDIEPSEWVDSGDAQVTLTFTDILDRLQRSETFPSTLAGHITGQRKATLVGYWPMTEPGLPLRDATEQQPAMTEYRANIVPPLQVPEFAVDPIALADDAAHPLFGFNPDGSTIYDTVLRSVLAAGLTVTSGEAVTMVAWINLRDYPFDHNSPGSPQSGCIALQLDLTENPADSSTLLVRGSSDTVWGGSAAGGAMVGGNLQGQGMANDAPFPIAIRYGIGPDVVEVWMRAKRLETAVIGSAPTSVTPTAIYAPRSRFSGLIGHLQLYVGDPDDFTFDDFRAQYVVGIRGLERQFSGERIATIAEYGGLAAHAVDLDPLPRAAYDLGSRTVSNGWDSAPSGQAWTTTGGSASDYSVGSGALRQSLGSTNRRTGRIDVGTPFQDILVTVNVPVNSAATAAIATRIHGRWTDASNYYHLVLFVTTGGAVQLALEKFVGGAGSTLFALANIATGHAAADQWKVRFHLGPTKIRVKAWLSTQSEPTDWLVSVADTSLATGDGVELVSNREAGNTDSTPVISWDDLVVREVTGHANSPMLATQLAGKTQADAMSDAVTTDNGDLFAAKDGTLTFRSRTRRLNLPAAATIQKAWLDHGLKPRLDGPILNVFDASIRDGATIRSKNQTSIDAVKVQAGEVTLEAASDQEAVDAAAWRTYNYPTQRTRVVALPIDLLHQDATNRATVFGLEIGNRLDLSGMPADYPVDADKVIIEGYSEACGTSKRDIVFYTSPVLGSTPGTPDEWFKLDDGTLGQLDAGNKLGY